MRNAALALTSFWLLGAMAPALAGNYAEGDPRHMSQPTQWSVSEVQPQTRTSVSSASAVGYPEGNPRAAVQTTQRTRAQVHAEAIAWTKSGMSDVAYGEVPMDSRGPSYERAVQVFNELSAGNRAAAAPDVPPVAR